MKKILLLTAAIAISALVFPILGHDDDHKHEHKVKHIKKAGPNGGRLLTKVSPQLEFKVLDDRKVKITAVDKDLKPIAIAAQVVRITAGERSNPVRMTFTKDGESLISDKAFPEGDDFPVVVQIKVKEGEKSIVEKFTMDFSDCPTCDYIEYACICDHGHDHDHDHKHDDDHKHDHDHEHDEKK